MSTTTTTVTLPCPECGEDISRQACIGHDRTNGVRVVWSWDAKDSAHACKPRGIDPESLEDWTLCEIEAAAFGTFYCEVMQGGYRRGTADNERRLPTSWRIVRTIQHDDRATTSEPDPPQPEWRDGDLVLDKDGYLWKRGYRYWYNAEDEWGVRGDDGLIGDRGPLRRAHLADPAKGEVVVSIEGLRKDVLRHSAQWDESDSYADSHPYRTFTRVAKAAQAAGLLDEEA